MKYMDLETPALLIDRERMLSNLHFMQDFANAHGVALRPHTKTHKMPAIAKLQLEAGACGIAVAKAGEAEVMAAHGITDIFIANQIVGTSKWQRLKALGEKINLSFGIDCPEQVQGIEAVFADSSVPAKVLIEIEVGENRSGIIEEADFYALLDALKAAPHVELVGLFSHDGNTYGAKDVATCVELAVEAQKRTVHFAQLAADYGLPCRVVSYGSTPTFMNNIPVVPGITEMRLGTYIFMDAAQGHAISSLDRCAATVLGTVISRPTAERVIMDVGAKGLTKEQRTEGICATPGMGTFYDYPHINVDKLFDEHTIIYNKELRDRVRVGDKLRIIPVHICPVCNLYDEAYLISGDEVVDVLQVACRGKQQ